MSRVKNQHYVPQFYLKRFSSDGHTITAFDKVNRKSFRTGVANVAGEQRFYDLPPGSNVQAVEKGFSALEAGYSEATKSLLDEVEREGRFTAGTSERNLGMAHFVATQYCRTREFRDTYRRAIEALARTINEKHEFARQNMAEQGEKFGVQPSGEPIPSEMEPLRQAHLVFGGTLLPRIVQAIFKHIWLVAENLNDQSLYTSDSPVVLNPHSIDPLYGGGGFGSPGIEILFPLSPRYILVLRERTFFERYANNSDGAVLQLRPEGVALYNHLQVVKSYRQIYCPEDRFEQVRELIEKFPEIGDLDRPRFSIKG